jgi:hypothetical protein
VGNLAGILAPSITGFVLERTGHFYWAFAIVAFFTFTGALSWLFVVGPVREVSWPKENSAVIAPAP